MTLACTAVRRQVEKVQIEKDRTRRTCKRIQQAQTLKQHGHTVEEEIIIVHQRNCHRDFLHSFVVRDHYSLLQSYHSSLFR